LFPQLSFQFIPLAAFQFIVTPYPAATEKLSQLTYFI